MTMTDQTSYLVTKTETITYTVEMTPAELASWLGTSPVRLLAEYPSVTDMQDRLNSSGFIFSDEHDDLETHITSNGNSDVQGSTFSVDKIGA